MTSRKENIPCRIIGVGNAGDTVVDRLIEEGFQPDECIKIGCGFQCQREGKCAAKIDLAPYFPRKGLDLGNYPGMCREAAIAGAGIIKRHLDGSMLNLIVAGVGGGMGTGATPVIAGISKEIGALTITIVSIPFSFEGRSRLNKAHTGIENMKSSADMIVLIPLDRLQHMLPPRTSIRDAFEIAANTLKNCVKELHYWLIHPSGEIDGEFESNVIGEMKMF